MIKGLDVGYSYTKDSSSNIFKSSYSNYDSSITDSKALVIDDKTYYVGSGKTISDMDKTDTEMNKVCTIYNLVKNNTTDVFMCVGLPIAQYKAQRDKLKETIMSYNKCCVMYDNKPQRILIRDVCVAMQGIASLYTLGKLDGEYIVVDVGGLTVDVSLVEFGTGYSTLKKKDTWYKGIRTLYSTIVEMVNNNFEIKLDNEYAEKILRHGLKVNGTNVDLSFLKPFLNGYLDEIIEDIKLRYPTETAPIVLTGGGTILLENSFKKRFKNVKLIPNAQFANAIGYGIIACNKFK